MIIMFRNRKRRAIWKRERERGIHSYLQDFLQVCWGQEQQQQRWWRSLLPHKKNKNKMLNSQNTQPGKMRRGQFSFPSSNRRRFCSQADEGKNICVLLMREREREHRQNLSRKNTHTHTHKERRIHVLLRVHARNTWNLRQICHCCSSPLDYLQQFHASFLMLSLLATQFPVLFLILFRE